MIVATDFLLRDLKILFRDKLLESENQSQLLLCTEDSQSQADRLLISEEMTTDKMQFAFVRSMDLEEQIIVIVDRSASINVSVTKHVWEELLKTMESRNIENLKGCLLKLIKYYYTTGNNCPNTINNQASINEFETKTHRIWLVIEEMEVLNESELTVESHADVSEHILMKTMLENMDEQTLENFLKQAAKSKEKSQINSFLLPNIVEEGDADSDYISERECIISADQKAIIEAQGMPTFADEEDSENEEALNEELDSTFDTESPTPFFGPDNLNEDKEKIPRSKHTSTLSDTQNTIKSHKGNKSSSSSNTSKENSPDYSSEYISVPSTPQEASLQYNSAEVTVTTANPMSTNVAQSHVLKKHKRYSDEYQSRKDADDQIINLLSSWDRKSSTITTAHSPARPQNTHSSAANTNKSRYRTKASSIFPFWSVAESPSTAYTHLFPSIGGSRKRSRASSNTRTMDSETSQSRVQENSVFRWKPVKEPVSLAYKHLFPPLRSSYR